MVKGQSMTQDQQVRTRLTELLHTLEQMESVVRVATAALEHQNADRDEDVARVIQRNVGDKLSTEIEKTAALLDRLPRPPAPRAKK